MDKKIIVLFRNDLRIDDPPPLFGMQQKLALSFLFSFKIHPNMKTYPPKIIGPISLHKTST